MTSTPSATPLKISSDMELLASWMAGDFSNYQQTYDNPKDFAHIRIFFRPLPYEFFSGIGFYSEQVYDHDLWSPYRQGIHRLVDRGDSVYIENYALNDAYLYAGSGHNRSILETIKPELIERRQNCSMVFTRDGDRFLGEVEGTECLIEKRDCLTYLISEVEITESTWASRDRGFDVKTHEVIWGSEHGPLLFDKRESFAHELPLGDT